MWSRTNGVKRPIVKRTTEATCLKREKRAYEDNNCPPEMYNLYGDKLDRKYTALIAKLLIKYRTDYHECREDGICDGEKLHQNFGLYFLLFNCRMIIFAKDWDHSQFPEIEGFEDGIDIPLIFVKKKLELERLVGRQPVNFVGFSDISIEDMIIMAQIRDYVYSTYEKHRREGDDGRSIILHIGRALSVGIDVVRAEMREQDQKDAEARRLRHLHRLYAQGFQQYLQQQEPELLFEAITPPCPPGTISNQTQDHIAQNR